MGQVEYFAAHRGASAHSLGTTVVEYEMTSMSNMTWLGRTIFWDVTLCSPQ
jgi:hypothetical protein